MHTIGLCAYLVCPCAWKHTRWFTLQNPLLCISPYTYNVLPRTAPAPLPANIAPTVMILRTYCVFNRHFRTFCGYLGKWYQITWLCSAPWRMRKYCNAQIVHKWSIYPPLCDATYTTRTFCVSITLCNFYTVQFLYTTIICAHIACGVWLYNICTTIVCIY